MSKQGLQMMTRLFLGVTTAPRSDWEYFFEPCVATKSRLPDSQAKEIARKEAQRATTAGDNPVSATVTSCYICDHEGREVFSALINPETPAGDVSARALAVLTTYMEQQGAFDSALRDVRVRLFGLKIRERLRIMALDALRYGAMSGQGVEVPAGLWYHQPFGESPWMDPYEAMIHSTQRQDISYLGLCHFLGIKVDLSQNADHDAILQANLAREIALRGKLFSIG